MFSDFAIWYLFLAGTAGGAFLCGVVMDMRENTGWDVRRVSLRARCGMFSCVGLLALAALMLFFDLGNPYDILYLFEQPLRSIVSVGAWLIVGCLACSVATSALVVLRIDVPWLFRILEILGGVAAVGVMGYTGVLLSSMTSIEFWNTPLVVVLFVASALSCGCACVEVATFFTAGSARGLRDLEGAGRILRVAEFAVLVAFMVSRWLAGAAAQQSCLLLVAGQLAGLFWGGLVLCGFAVPALAGAGMRALRVPALRLAGAASTLIGGVCLRYCVVLAASYSAIGFAVT